MKNLRIGKKLFLSYAVVLCLLIVSTVVSVANLLSINKQVKDFYNNPYTVRGAANTIKINLESLQKSVFRAVANTSADATQEALNETKEAAAVVEELMPIIKNRFKGDQKHVANFEKAWLELTPMRAEVLLMASENRNEEAVAYMESHNIPEFEKIIAELDEIINFANQRGESLLDKLQTTQTNATVMLTILGIASVVFTILMGLYIVKSITNPVKELERASEKLAKGELDAVIAYESRDELGGLANSMRITISRLAAMISDLNSLLKEVADGNFDNDTKSESSYVGAFQPLLASVRQMNRDLSNTLLQINQSADQVASGSEQVSFGAQALSQGATEQASSVEELASTVSNMSGQIEQSAQNAQQARKAMDETAAKLMESNDQMVEMTKAMGEISASSGEIGKIIKTIEDIAFQTNILALNAAVEAARAGTAGKGFAVVADEVRNLANKSSEASQSTSALIESSLRAVDNGTKIADVTAASLLSVVEETKKSREQISQIADASKSQAQSAAQVTQGISQISDVVQTNSATAEESAAASQELSGQSQILKELVSRFRLQGGENGRSQSSYYKPEAQISLGSGEERIPLSLNMGKY